MSEFASFIKTTAIGTLAALVLGAGAIALTLPERDKHGNRIVTTAETKPVISDEESKRIFACAVMLPEAQRYLSTDEAGRHSASENAFRVYTMGMSNINCRGG